MNPEQQQVLFENTARNMNGVEDFIKIRHIIHCYKADPAYGQGVAAAMELPWERIEEVMNVTATV